MSGACGSCGAAGCCAWTADATPRTSVTATSVLALLITVSPFGFFRMLSSSSLIVLSSIKSNHVSAIAALGSCRSGGPGAHRSASEDLSLRLDATGSPCCAGQAAETRGTASRHRRLGYRRLGRMLERQDQARCARDLSA